MSDPLWRVGVGVKENAVIFGVLGFLAGAIFTFAACAPSENPIPQSHTVTQ
jgi:hypothetical protein